ncbi:Diphthamide biosynthesis protein 3 OS=Ustilago maydis (strain 521 / FGSC 9021) GN=DPH3 PE=3 SV=1 [Rhizoctonia solani AG-1 IB]|uniref:Diphthamide biosynthesis protein 3 n=1 Tax=Thanatephorus cucumeris (strain AG1-IB / isolate 7/3/14) TaxID=1108050 RepID=A0A0B7FTD5_THACB|nr:Diphthamide biosynthesis protein 3 OS=Ustilago maydis (strain 521 / FGSC 9021) GN=DPH3 PE=3 SV=1 [Rhizoctonia solani AG-1 IB]
MGISYYDEVEIEDMTWDEAKGVFHYPCPCGDRFEISRQQLANYEDIATCPSCSLIIRVIFDPLDFEDEEPDEDDDDPAQEEDDSDSDEHGNGDEKFEEAMENLSLGGDEPAVVTLVPARA